MAVDMNLFGRRFAPPMWSIALTAAGMLLFVMLGNWQLDRADYKDRVQNRFEQRLLLDSRRFSAADKLNDLEYRKLIVEGRFDEQHHFLLDNQLHQGRAGYHVLTPLHLRDSDHILLVNRGWAAWGESRDPLPRIPAPLAAAEIVGIANFPSEPVMKLGGYQLGSNWPQLIPYIEIESLREQYSERLLPIVLWLSPDQPGAYVRVWNPVWMPPEKSRAYALQWFSFAAVALVLFIVLNLRKVE